MNFRIDSHPVSMDSLCPTARNALTFLGKLPAGELVTMLQLSVKLGVSVNTLKNLVGRVDWGGRRIRHGNRMLYGNPKTIKAYAEHFGL